MFVDALIYLCEKPRTPGDIHVPLHYKHPETMTAGIEQGISQMMFTPTQKTEEVGGVFHMTEQPLTPVMDVNSSSVRSDPPTTSTRTRIRHIRGK